ncbi:DsbA family oxidoreductase [Chryseobacterium sp. SSA4.19]|uniref:DsbA family oxidoreductase n=1 Tax=Chryseobacterium sp. SSA4.19 TaxID=2919915 RepID=UPI001F4E487D|nr:DsbA family oxidoreductase [Chryseobacterium sp. SSA4.19]MCJ8153398.1 DsbA family oxidoreductase [Chryseobacterium sp. SSA4.19]
MKIEIWSDVMCPFCYIGKNNFEKALENLPFKNEVEVEWKSFQLDPALPADKSLSTFDYFREKKGFPEAQARQMIAQVKEMGSSAGINFNFENALIVNTFPAHKILHLAKKHRQSNEMEDALFRAHFTDGKNVSDTQTLISLADSLGIDKQETEQVLTSKAFNNEVSQDILDAKKHGISGVPFFVLNGKYAVSGAQPVEVFQNALIQTYNETVLPLQNLTKDDHSNSCDTEGNCTI